MTKESNATSLPFREGQKVLIEAEYVKEIDYANDDGPGYVAGVMLIVAGKTVCVRADALATEQPKDAATVDKAKYDATWIQVYPGQKFEALDPRKEDLTLEAIAHSLSMQCRYAGHISQFYSVAQHCLLVSRICDPEDALAGLLHDASEAYLVDIPSPIKKDPRFSFYRTAEDKLQGVIAAWAGLETVMPSSVRRADAEALAIEADNFLPVIVDNWTHDIPRRDLQLIAMPPSVAKYEYIKRFNELTYHRNGERIGS
jgi:hypothetical protein